MEVTGLNDEAPEFDKYELTGILSKVRRLFATKLIVIYVLFRHFLQAYP